MGVEPALRHTRRAHSSSNLFAREFPVPEILFPRSAGIDISDASIKWLVLANRESEEKVATWGEEHLQEGIVAEGMVRDVPALAAALGAVKSRLGGVYAVHAALPEEAAYIFDMHVPEGSSRKSILNMIEFELEGRVPIPPGEAVYDFDVISEHGSAGEHIGVVVFPRELSENYAKAFDMSGIKLLSLEVEARSVARAVTGGAENDPVTLVVDFGRMRTGFAVLKGGVPIFSSTVGVGGVAMTRALVEKAGLTPEEAEKFKDEKGLLVAEGEKNAATEVLVATASALADEVLRHYRYWDSRRNEQGQRVTPVENVLLVGGSANLKGLSDYISSRVQAPAALPNVWQHICSFEEYIPPIDRATSMQYVTAIGLALRGA
ncbi:hypothetical protein C4585_03010 [Candidatus Parcubacteria bacterium]|nr:MAG: hypothetical protein C4585_03010 [Candidatus Parcubacteria bacterium]